MGKSDTRGFIKGRKQKSFLGTPRRKKQAEKRCIIFYIIIYQTEPSGLITPLVIIKQPKALASVVETIIYACFACS